MLRMPQDDVACRGTEASLADCPFRGWNMSNCAHSEDVRLYCAGAGNTQNITGARPAA